MNIKGMGRVTAIDAYSINSKNKVEKAGKTIHGDRIELSETAKALKEYSIGIEEYDKSHKVEEIKRSISNGTYNIDAKLTAESILKVIKEK